LGSSGASRSSTRSGESVESVCRLGGECASWYWSLCLVIRQAEKISNLNFFRESGIAIPEAANRLRLYREGTLMISMPDVLPEPNALPIGAARLRHLARIADPRHHPAFDQDVPRAHTFACAEAAQWPLQSRLSSLCEGNSKSIGTNQVGPHSGEIISRLPQGRPRSDALDIS